MHLLALRCSLLVLLVSSCSGGEGPLVGPFGSGARLRAVVLQPKDGMGGRLQHFRDSTLEMDCSFRATGDELRCLPTERPYLHYFVDSACTRIAVDAPAADARQGSWIISDERSACGPRPAGATPYRLGEARPTGYEMVDGECQPVEIELAVFHAIEEEDVAIFARGKMVDGERVRRVVSDDGAWLNLYGRNEGGEACGAMGDEPHCVPAPTAIGLVTFFDNDRCESTNSAWAYTPEDCTWQPSWSIPIHADSLTFMPVIAPLETHWRVNEESGLCEATEAYTPALRVGEPVGLDFFPALPTHLSGSGRIQTRFAGWDQDDPIANSARFWDTHHDEGCSVMERAGLYYCVPLSNPRNYYGLYADECASDLVWRAESAFAPEILVDASGSDFRFFEPIELTGTLYRRYQGDCYQHTPAAGFKYYVPGAELPAAEMPGWLVLSVE